tara:strand:+ start:788 stop:2491 length:1704 start_codon:yes stop_codon:yes gene_type:complete
MDYTKEELIAALGVANEEQDLEGVNALVSMLDEISAQEEAQTGYQPTDYNLTKELGEGLGRIGEKIGGLSNFALQQGVKTQALGGSPSQAILPIAGETVSSYITTPISEALGFGGKAILELTDDSFEKKVADLAIGSFKTIMDSPLAQKGLEAANYSIGKWSEFSKAFPLEADNLKGAVQIAEIYTPAKFRKPVPLKASELKKQGIRLQREAATKTLESKRSNMFEVIKREDTKANRLIDVKNKITDPDTGRTVLIPTPMEIDMADVLLEKTKVSVKNSDQLNLDILKATVKARGQKLTNELRQYDYVKFKREDIRGEMNSLIDDLLDPSSSGHNPALSGATRSQAAKDLFTWIDNQLGKGDITPARLYELRKELDTYIKQLKGSAFDGTQTAQTEAKKAVRNYLNTKVIEGAPFADVADDLKDMHLMFEAIDRITPKAAEALETAFARGLQNVARVTDTVMPKTIGGKIATLGIITGAGFTGALQTTIPFLPFVAGSGGIGYLAYRGVNSPHTRKKIGQAIVAIDKALKITGAREMKEALALDRATLIEAMKYPLADIEEEDMEDR